jgi:hypothetical protein
MRLPETCAHCGHSAKVSVNYRPKKDIGWYCSCDPYGDDVEASRVARRPRGLPPVPKWCPLRLR